MLEACRSHRCLTKLGLPWRAGFSMTSICRRPVRAMPRANPLVPLPHLQLTRRPRASGDHGAWVSASTRTTGCSTMLGSRRRGRARIHHEGAWIECPRRPTHIFVCTSRRPARTDDTRPLHSLDQATASPQRQAAATASRMPFFFAPSWDRQRLPLHRGLPSKTNQGESEDKRAFTPSRACVTVITCSETLARLPGSSRTAL